MNKKQRIALAIGTVLIALSIFYAPYKETVHIMYDESHSPYVTTLNIGNSSIFSPPEPLGAGRYNTVPGKTGRERYVLRGDNEQGGDIYTFRVELDGSTFTLRALFFLVLTAGAILSLTDRRKYTPEKP